MLEWESGSNQIDMETMDDLIDFAYVLPKHLPKRDMTNLRYSCDDIVHDSEPEHAEADLRMSLLPIVLCLCVVLATCLKQTCTITTSEEGQKRFCTSIEFNYDVYPVEPLYRHRAMVEYADRRTSLRSSE